MKKCRYLFFLMGNGLFFKNNLTISRRKNSLGLWSPEEKLEIENAQKVLKESAEFVAEHFYYGVQVVVTRQSHDPLAPIWVTPNTYKVMQRVEASEQLELQKDWEMIYNVPTTVMITYKGKIVVIFEKSSIKYELRIDDVINARKKTFENQSIIPSPPILDHSSTNSLALSWNLPDPPGISQYVEVQYRRYRLSSNPHVLHLLEPPSAWSALVSRAWDKESFTSYLFSDLNPGTSYQFRLRYRSHRGWSDFSEPSLIYSTHPTPPATPKPPVSSAILPHAIHLSWSYPWHNGSLVTSFTLEGKSVGETEFHELFQGLMLAHIVFGLQPNNAYIFRLKATNAIGDSSYCEYYSVQTPSQYSLPLRQLDWRVDFLGFSDEYLNDEGSENFDSLYSNAMRCRDAWRQFFDIQTQQNFYFNILTGSRQLQPPRALQTSSQQSEDSADPDGKKFHDLEVEVEKSIQFRVKRFHFMKDLRSYRQDNSITSISPLRTNSVFTLAVDRKRIVHDTYSLLSSLRSGGVGGDLRKRFRVQFQNEIGIDSGGLTKEYFLLLSKQMIQYLLIFPNDLPVARKKWIKLTSSHRLFFNEVAASDLEPIYQTLPIEPEVSGTVIDNYRYLNRISGKEYLRFVGRMIGKALYDNQMIDVSLAGILLAYMTTSASALRGNPVNDEDIFSRFIFSGEEFKDYDPDLHQSLSWMLSNDISTAGLDDTTFTVTGANGQEILLCKGGDQRSVTEENKREYVQYLIQWKVQYSVAVLLQEFLEVIEWMWPFLIFLGLLGTHST